MERLLTMMLVSHLSKEGKEAGLTGRPSDCRAAPWKSQPPGSFSAKNAQKRGAKMTANGKPLDPHDACHWLETAQKVSGLQLKAKTDLEVLGLS